MKLILILLVSISHVIANDTGITLLKTEYHNDKYTVSNLKEFLKGKTIVESVTFMDNGKKVCNILKIDNDFTFEYMFLKGTISVNSNRSFTLNFANNDVPSRTIQLEGETPIFKMRRSNPYYIGRGAAINIMQDKPKSLIRLLFTECEQNYNCKKLCL